MKTTAILGSPRENGNTSIVHNYFVDKLKEKHEVFNHDLRCISFSGCKGCMACKNNFKYCIIKDGLSEILEEIKISQTLILSSPVYFNDVTWLMKKFIDRTFSFANPDFMVKKKSTRIKDPKNLIFIQTQAKPSPVAVFENYNQPYFIDKWGFENTFLMRTTGVYEKGDLRIDDSIENKINEIINMI